jgi:hypothetical protein
MAVDMSRRSLDNDDAKPLVTLPNSLSRVDKVATDESGGLETQQTTPPDIG